MGTTFPIPSVETDAALSEYEQGWRHHALFYKLFRPDSYSAADLRGCITRIHAFVARGIPILYPDTLRDITEASLRKFITDTWHEDLTPEMCGLVKAYVKSGPLRLDDVHFGGEKKLPVYTDHGPTEPVGELMGTVLQQAIMTGSPELIEALLEAGSDPRLVPVTHRRNHSAAAAMGEAPGTLAKGDAVAFAEAYHGVGSRVSLAIKASLMQIQIAEAAAAATGSHQLKSDTSPAPSAPARRAARACM